MTTLFYYFPATCKCQAPASWGIIQRNTYDLEIEPMYVPDSSSIEVRDMIREYFGGPVVSHDPLIQRPGGPLVLVSSNESQDVLNAVREALVL